MGYRRTWSEEEGQIQEEKVSNNRIKLRNEASLIIYHVPSLLKAPNLTLSLSIKQS